MPGATNVGLNGQFAIWAATLISMEVPIVIVSESEEKTNEAVTRLARVGIESVKGYLAGGISAWHEAGLELATVAQITVHELNDLMGKQTPLQIIDVRRLPEYESGHVPGRSRARQLQTGVPSLELDWPVNSGICSAATARARYQILHSRVFTSPERTGAQRLDRFGYL